MRTPEDAWDAGAVAADEDAPNCAATFDLEPREAWACPWDQLAADPDAADLVAELRAACPALAAPSPA